MDKYQEFALKYSGYAVYKNKDLSDDIKKFTNINETDGKIRIVQDEDYKITKYYLRFQTAVYTVIANGKKYEHQELAMSSHPSVIVPIDFDHKIKEVTLCYDGTVEPITIKLEYISADKEAYNQKVKAQIIEENSKKINPECKTGRDLVNIYWDIATKDVKKVELNLCLSSGRKIISYKESANTTFKSIVGLAEGCYTYEIIELDGKGVVVAKTEQLKFRIGAAPQQYVSSNER